MKKKIFQTIQLKRFKTRVDNIGFNPFEGMYFVLFQDGKYELCWNKEELLQIVEKDHIRPIRYIAAKTDLIYLDREIQISGEEIL